MSNGTPKTLIPFDGVIKWDKVLKKLSDRPKCDHVTHFKSWIKNLFIALNSVYKCSYINDIIESDPMM